MANKQKQVFKINEMKWIRISQWGVFVGTNNNSIVGGNIYCNYYNRMSIACNNGYSKNYLTPKLEFSSNEIWE